MTYTICFHFLLDKMYKVTSFLKRLPFLEVHPLMVGCIVLFPISVVGLHSYLFVYQNDLDLDNDVKKDINNIQQEIQNDYENNIKNEGVYDRITRPNRYTS